MVKDSVVGSGIILAFFVGIFVIAAIAIYPRPTTDVIIQMNWRIDLPDTLHLEGEYSGEKSFTGDGVDYYIFNGSNIITAGFFDVAEHDLPLEESDYDVIRSVYAEAPKELRVPLPEGNYARKQEKADGSVFLSIYDRSENRYYVFIRYM